VLPMAFYDLGENMKIQILSFVTLLFVLITWMVACIMNGLQTDKIQLIGRDHSLVVGTVLFNYAFIIAVPSMVNDLVRMKQQSFIVHQNVFFFYYLII
jgi:hypothetical protein